MLTNRAVALTSGGEQDHSNTHSSLSSIPQDDTGRIICPYVPLKCIRATG